MSAPEAPMVSIIVCTYNRCESLRDTLKTLAAQSVPAGNALEIIVVDNNSTDETKQTVESMAKSCRWPLRYVFEANQGLSFARNRGIAEARGSMIAFTDDDVLPTASWVQRLVDAFEDYQADAVGGRVLPRWLSNPPPWVTYPSIRGQVLASLAMLDHGDDVIVMDASRSYFLAGANMAFRKAALEEVGGFRTDLGRVGKKLISGDDTEMIQRLFDAGKRVVYAPEAVVHHKVQPERMRLGYFRRWRFHGSRSFRLMSTQGRGDLPAWLIKECVVNGLGSLWAYAAGQTERAIRRDLSFWAQLGQIVAALESRLSPTADARCVSTRDAHPTAPGDA